ncbi:MAG: aminoacyl-tRNA hydrolase [Woeseia sp.]|nr:aminoacyl-tRNA hydrolase [Woeseia sp.]NNL55914.1 aminoacyl-tRNA hydrolase [Woeseia sp.]
MLEIGGGVTVPGNELVFSAIRAQGAGGQNVNKVASAVHLRFDSQHSAVLPDHLKQRLLSLSDRRIGKDGVITIKAQRHRTQEQNRRDALLRLKDLLQKGMARPKPRKRTRPSRRQREKRLQQKSHRSELKAKRRPVRE